VRVTNTPARWLICFVIVPAAWLTFGVATDMNIKIMIPSAVVAAALSAVIAYSSGHGHREALLYFITTGAMMAVAFAIFVITVFTYYCRGGDTSGGC
jgi:hypothetical protein